MRMVFKYQIKVLNCYERENEVSYSDNSLMLIFFINHDFDKLYLHTINQLHTTYI